MNSTAHSVLFQLSHIFSDLEDYVQIIVFVDFDVVFALFIVTAIFSAQGPFPEHCLFALFLSSESSGDKRCEGVLRQELA